MLIVAGDTANSIGDLVKFLRKLNKKNFFKHILFIEGNHENYSNASRNRSIAQTLTRIDELKPEGTTFLSTQRAVKIGDYYFVGRCGWYSMDAAGDPIANRARWKEVMNDDRWIGFTKRGEDWPWELARQHAQEIDEIITETLTSDPAARFIVVTHMAPCRESLGNDPRHLLDNAFYANLHLTGVMERHAEHIEAWVHGHTHLRSMRKVHGVEVIVNPRGYPRENPNWEPVVLDFPDGV